MRMISKDEVESIKEEIARIAEQTTERILQMLAGDELYRDTLLATCLQFAGAEVWEKVSKRLKESSELEAKQQLSLLVEELYFLSLLYARLYTFHRFYLTTMVPTEKAPTEATPDVTAENAPTEATLDVTAEDVAAGDSYEEWMLKMVSNYPQGFDLDSFLEDKVSGEQKEAVRAQMLTFLEKAQEAGLLVKEEGLWKRRKE